jgi:hypothetical protein
MSNYKWTPFEKQFIAENAATMTDKQLAQELTSKAAQIGNNRTYTLKSVRLVRQKLGLKKKNGRGVCKLL